MEITVVSHSMLGPFISQCNKLLADGWSLQGNMVVSVIDSGQNDLYTQMFIREIKPDESS